jgi:hypothetical protein
LSRKAQGSRKKIIAPDQEPTSRLTHPRQKLLIASFHGTGIYQARRSELRDGLFDNALAPPIIIHHRVLKPLRGEDENRHPGASVPTVELVVMASTMARQTVETL